MKRILIATAALLISPAAFSTPILPDTGYDLANHPDGAMAPPPYGLRLDGLLTGNSNDEYTFDFEHPDSAMSMLWNDGAGTLTIWGSAYGGEDTGSSYSAGTTAIWDIEFNYTGVYACGSGLCANDGTGSLTSDFGTYNMVAESGNHSYAFQLNTGHRGFAGISGWGWLNHCPAEGTDEPDTSCERHLYASDWLFTATQKVPEPGTLGLLGMALAGLGFARRRRC